MPESGPPPADTQAKALLRLALALIDVQALARALAPEPAVSLPDCGPDVHAQLRRLAEAFGLPTPRTAADPSGLSAAELAMSSRLAAAAPAGGTQLNDVPDGAIAVAAELARSSRPRTRVIRATDGSPLRYYTAGSADQPAVALVSACGMPVGMLDGWISGLADRFRVVTWESRGLFDRGGGLDPAFDERGQDVRAQADDLLAVLDAAQVDRAHLVGLCGGAAIALAVDMARVSSLSLWYGDYELGPDIPKTDHQKDVQSLMLMAGRHRGRATGLHAMLSRPATLGALRSDIAHHLIYPYATPELLYRYGRLNGAIMTTDCRPRLPLIDVPALVVSSESDTTAHPAGSVFVAEGIGGARLELLPDGGHLAAFDAAPAMIDLASAFIDGVLA